MTCPTLPSGATSQLVEPISVALAHDLDELLTDLARYRFDAPPTVTALRRDARLAVRSFLGFLVTVLTDDDVCVTITQVDHDLDPSEVKTSLRLDLRRQSPDWPPSVVTLYAARAGAMVDLAADLAVALGVPDDAVVLDSDLPASTVRAGVTGLSQVDVVQRAIGVRSGRHLTGEDLSSREAIRRSRSPIARGADVPSGRATRPSPTSTCSPVLFILAARD